MSLEELGHALKIFLEKGMERETIEKTLQVARAVKEPHLEQEVREFVEQLERLMATPSEELTQQVRKRALHLEQETREI